MFILGGYTALSTKGVASLLSYTLFKALTFPITYLLVAILVFTAVMQIKYLNRALRRFNATEVIPTQFVLFTLSVIIGSAVLYRDFERTPRDDAIKFIGGCAFTFIGVWLITSARSRESDEEEGFEEDDEAIRLAQSEPYQDVVPSSTSSMRQHSISSASRLPNGHESPYRQQSLSEAIPTPRRQPRHPSPPSTPTPIIATPIPSTPEEPPSIPSTYQESSPLTENPWVHPDDLQSKARQTMRKLLQPLTLIWPHESSESLPAPLPESNSAPVLPFEARIHSSRPQTPRNQRDSHGQPATPVAPHTTDDSHRLSRSSFSTLVPGPLAGTLSTPLSAIVADSLRRGVDVSSIRPKRRRRIKLPGIPWNAQLRRRGNSETDVGHAATARDSLLDLYAQSPSGRPRIRTEGEVENGDEGAGDASRSRARSFSNALVDMFSRKRPRLNSAADDANSSSEPLTPATEPSSLAR
jgi:magnesium transporter